MAFSNTNNVTYPSDWYEAYDNPPPIDSLKKAAEYSVFVGLSNHFSGGESLDVGTATGRYLLASHHYGFRSFGIDISPEAVGHTKRRLKESGLPLDRVLVGDVHALPFDNERFSLVTCMMGTIHHCIDQQRAIQEMSRVLSPSGLLIMSKFDEKNESSIQLSLIGAEKREIIKKRAFDDFERTILDAGLTVEIKRKSVSTTLMDIVQGMDVDVGNHIDDLVEIDARIIPLSSRSICEFSIYLCHKNPA